MANSPPPDGHQQRITAVVIARDEWPLLGIAVVHALRLGFDEVVVFDHASVDGTERGLAAIAAQYPGRLRVFRSEDPGFQQESATAILIEAASAGGADWVYVFDADEFLLVDPTRTIHEVLGDVPAEAVAVRYQVHNWVAPTDFDDRDLNDYSRLRHRARFDPSLPARVRLEDRKAALARGDVNFFAFPFKSKVIVRGGADIWLAAGSHDLLWPARTKEVPAGTSATTVRSPADTSDQSGPGGAHDPLRRAAAVVVELPETTLRAAHLPLLSSRRMQMRADRARWRVGAGLPGWFGWHQFDSDGLAKAGVDDFWARHSLGPDGDESDHDGPPVVADAALAGPLQEAATELARYDAEESSAPASIAQSEIPLELAVAALQRVQRMGHALAEPGDSAGKGSWKALQRRRTRDLRVRATTGIRRAAKRLRDEKYRGGS